MVADRCNLFYRTMGGEDPIKKPERKIEGRKKALIISVSDYHNQDLSPIPFSKKDGGEMYKVLISQGYEIPDDRRLIGSVNWKDMRDMIIKFFLDHSHKKDDTLLFYFSGHGIPDGTGEFYLPSSEVEPDNPMFRAISFAEVSKVVNNATPLKKIVIFDCSFSGAAKFDDSVCFLASSLPFQASYGLPNQDHSIFTYFLLEGLRGVEECVDNKGNVTSFTLRSYIYNKMKELKIEKKLKQTPVIRIETAGEDIVFASYPELTRGEYLYTMLKDSKISEFNELRKKHHLAYIDLYRKDLGHLNLSGTDLHKANLQASNLNGTILERSDLRGADLRQAQINKSNLSGSNLRGADLRSASLIEADLREVNLCGALLGGANLNRAKLNGSYLATSFRGVSLEGADFRSACFNETDFGLAKLIQANFQGTDLNGVSFNKANINKTDLRHAKNLPFPREEGIRKGAILE